MRYMLPFSGSWTPAGTFRARKMKTSKDITPST